MADIYLEALTYRKTETDALIDAEEARVDALLDLKVDTTNLGSPSGVSTLDASGTHPAAEIPFATTEEANTGTATDKVINPDTLNDVISNATNGLYTSSTIKLSYDGSAASTDDGTDNHNIAIGTDAAEGIDAGRYSIAMGYNALKNSSGGSYSSLHNIAIGSSAMSYSSSGDYNITIGNACGYTLSGGDRNILLGYYAGERATTGNDNICIGNNAGEYVNDGDRNIFIGFESGQASNSNKITGGVNIAIGENSGKNLTSGGYNTFLGYGSGDNVTTGLRNVCIGYGGQPTNATDNDKLIIGNLGHDPLLEGDFATEELHVNGDLTANNLSSGTYTPTMGATSNISAISAEECYYMRVGNIVTVGGTINITVITTGNLVAGTIELPIASAFTDTYQASGHISGSSVTLNPTTSGLVKSSPTSDVLGFQFEPSVSGAGEFNFHVTYQII